MEVLVYQGETEKKSCGVLQLTYGLEQSDQIYTFFCDTDGDSLVLRKRQGPIAVYEIAVIGEGTFLSFELQVKLRELQIIDHTNSFCQCCDRVLRKTFQFSPL